MNDIVFSNFDFKEVGAFFNDGMGWIPIGGDFSRYSAYYYEFKGNFNGNGYTIKNIKMDRKPTSDWGYPSTRKEEANGSISITYTPHSFGLFARNAGVIKNLNVVVDYTIDANPSAVAGGICGANSGTVANCHTSGTIFTEKTSDSYDSYFGGVVGSLDGGTITYCSNNINISGNNPYSFTYLNCGGIIGRTNGRDTSIISYYYNTGTIAPNTVSKGYLAGIAARSSDVLYEGYSLTIENCYNAGTIGSDTYSGKIAGICAIM